MFAAFELVGLEDNVSGAAPPCAPYFLCDSEVVKRRVVASTRDITELGHGQPANTHIYNVPNISTIYYTCK
jgi:hypothetical protein